MKFCPECGNKRGFQEYECSCGYHYENYYKQTFPGFNQNPAFIKAFENAYIEKKKLRFKMAMSLNLIVIFTALIIVFNEGVSVIPPTVIVSAFVLMFIYCSLLANNRLTFNEYNDLQGTTDPDGKHICIMCGNYGIQRKVVDEAQNIIECRCSKCLKHLFNE